MTEVMKYETEHQLFNPTQEIFEERLYYFIKKQVKILGLNDEYTHSAISIYTDILNSLRRASEENPFKIFYNKLKLVKKPRFVSAALLLFILYKNRINIRQLEIANVLKINDSDTIGKPFNSLVRMVQHLPNYSYIARFIDYRLLPKELFPFVVKEQIKLFSQRLAKKYLLKDEETTHILRLFNIYSSVLEKNFDKMTLKVPLKHPKYIATTMCYVYLTYFKDIELSVMDFAKLIDLKGEIPFESTASPSQTQSYNISIYFIVLLRKNINEFVCTFFKFNRRNYKAKVKHYIEKFILVIENWGKKHLDNKEVLPRILNELNLEMVHKCLLLFDKVIKKGFKINDCAKNSTFFFYFPQVMALTLLFRLARNNDTLCSIFKKALLKDLINQNLVLKKVNCSAQYITQYPNRLYPFLQAILGRYKGQWYKRNDFVALLRSALKRFYHTETDFLLQLYSMTNLTPAEFGKRLNIHAGKGVISILQIVNKRTKFTEPHIFSNINDFILSHLNGKDQSKALNWLEQIKNTREKGLNHGGVLYSFKWNEERIRGKTILHDTLNQYLLNIYEGNYPREHFMDTTNFRASYLELQGTRKNFLKTNTIETFLKSKLTYYTHHYLIDHARDVFAHFKKHKIGKTPDHLPVQNYIISNDIKAIAMEIPTWKEIQGLGKYFIGHIDLLLLENDTLIVCDYKQEKRKIIKYLPQICAYGILLRERLNEYDNVRNIKLKCIGFTKNIAIEFNPDVILSEIIQLVKTQNKQRTHNLMYVDRRNKKKADLLMLLEYLHGTNGIT
ncbi:MAG: hypothetical protein ACFFAH_03605 [Promethearchaeota archaeon]